MDLKYWRKASYSSGNGGDCVEVGAARRTIAVRDTKDREGPALAFSPHEWRTFIEEIKTGR